MLIAEDDFTNRRLLEVTLQRWGFETLLARDGEEAWRLLQGEDAPPLAILDWMMPGLDGLEVCRRVRAAGWPRLTYIILLTARAGSEDLVTGLQAGADDYVVKPFEHAELRARVQVGVRAIEMHARLREQERELGAARARITERERFEAAVSAMSDGLVATDGAWRVTTTNRAARVLLGILDEEPNGRSLAELLAPFSLTVAVHDLLAGAARETRFQVAREHTHPPLYLDARLTRVYDEGGELAGGVLLLRDVTQEHLLSARRSAFLSLVSHKLRTPLTVVSGFLHLLRTLPLELSGEERERLLAACDAQLRRLSEDIAELLAVKELTPRAGARISHATPLLAAVHHAMEAVRAAYPNRQVVFCTDLDPPDQEVDVHPEDLSLLLHALLENAVKFGDKEPTRVSVSARPDPRGNPRVTISDN
ncbi:MAG: response regulator, partial [Armatimonadota bacterium]|nr:response regulator [Armatimonadota bacterium]